MQTSQKIIFSVLLACLITGCSKKAEEYSQEDTSSHEQAVAIESSTKNSEDPVAADAAPEPNTTPQTEQKPETILNTQVSTAETKRRMVREANIDFTAVDVVKTALEIDKLTYQAGGFVEQKNIDFTVLSEKSQAIADGKIKIFEEVNPYADIVVRVPSEKAAAFVNQLLPLMQFLDQQRYSAKSFDLKLLEEKIQQTQIVPSDTPNPQIREINRLTQIEVQDRVRYSTIHIHIKQQSTIRERYGVDVAEIARLNGDSFWTRAWNGIQSGWYFILNVLIFLVTIWPLYFIAAIVFAVYYLIVKKFK